ncbi:hypothetical protein [Halorussus sp. AFM4]|uniref:hypothetical protein n=1 Tax=Halorussus sp. AFM4 TaxID=3421651 RepID=UPI003EBCAF64
MPSPTDAPETPRNSRSFGTRLQVAWERATDNLPLALVPLLSSLLAPDDVRRVLAAEDLNFGIAFRFPAALPDLWSFVSLPSQPAGVHVSPTLWLLPVAVLVRAGLVAGLLGSAWEAVETGRYDFAANARQHFVPVLVFVALVRVVGVGAVALAATAPLLVLLAVPLFLLLSYLFYATPYLLVVAEDSVGEALARSYDWAVGGGPYLSYAGGYLLAVVAVSVFVSAFVVNLGVVGVAVGAAVTAPVALALTFATTEFVADLAGERGAGAGDPRGPGAGGRGPVAEDRRSADADPGEDFDSAADSDERGDADYRDRREDV